jgi:hypothetical protein
MLTITESKDKFRSLDSIEQLYGCRLPTREEIGASLKEGAVGSWEPIRHSELVACVEDSLNTRGIKHEITDLFVSKDDYSLLMGVTLPGFLDTPDLVPGLFVRHSNDQSQALMVGIGGEVFVCSNGMITASWSVRTKHNRNLHLPSFVDKAVVDGLNSLRDQDERVQHLKNEGMPFPAEALLELHREGGISQRACHRAWEEWVHPSYPYEESMHGSRWSWYNAVTVAAKELCVNQQTRVLERAFEYAERN